MKNEKNEKDVLFNDYFGNVKLDVKEVKKYPNIEGNYRLSNGQYRTDAEKNKYRKKSLERELP